MRDYEYNLYQSHVQKLRDFCQSAELGFVLDCGKYPITLTVRPGQYYPQMSLLDTPEPERTDAAMIFTLTEGEIRFTAVGGFVVNDATFGKIKGLFRKIAGYWTQCVFRRSAEAQDERFRDLWRRAHAEMSGED